jgi:outer membrane protein OmpA-like peptidoglycan-associated protein
MRAVLLLAAAASLLSAQPLPKPWIRLGAFAGYGATIYAADFRQLPGIPNCCPGFDGGRGTGLSLALIGEYPWYPLAWLNAQLSYWNLSGNLWKQEQIGNVALVSPGGDTSVLPARVEHVLNAHIGVIALEGGVSSRFFERFLLRVGIIAALPVQKQFEQYERLLSPEGFLFAREGSRIRNRYAGSIPQAPVALLGSSFSVGYALPAGADWELLPTLAYAIFLNNLSSVPWKPSALRVGLAVMRTLRRPPEPLYDTLYQRDTLAVEQVGLESERLELAERTISTDTLRTDALIRYRTTIAERWVRRIPRQPRLELSLRFAPTAEPVRLEELEQEEFFPLLPYVFFPEGSADLARTRMRLLSPQEAAEFDERALPMQTLQLYAHLLNIVGARLKQLPQARLTITGCVSNVGEEQGNLALARRRAEAVRDYLMRVWGIDSSRLVLRARLLPAAPSNPATPEGQEENRRVELSSATWELLAPVRLAEIGYILTPATLEVLPSVETEAGLEHWELELRSARHVLARSEGSQLPAAVEFAPPAQLLSLADSLLVAQLRVRDRFGQERSATAVLPLQRLTLRQKRAERFGNQRRERFVLTLFEFDKATLTEEHRRLLQLVRQRLRPGMHLVIAGYTDRTGDPAHNRRLAEQRCQNVWRFLQQPGITAELQPIGSDVLLYPNELPEGRAYSRTVHIDLFSPIE